MKNETKNAVHIHCMHVMGRKMETRTTMWRQVEEQSSGDTRSYRYNNLQRGKSKAKRKGIKRATYMIREWKANKNYELVTRKDALVQSIVIKGGIR